MTYNPFGRLGNRLFLFAHLIAFSDYHHVNVRNYAFFDYAKDFSFWTDSKTCDYPEPSSRRTRVASLGWLKVARSLRMVRHVEFWDERDIIFDEDDSADSRVRQMVEAPVVIFEGWSFRSHQQIRKSLPAIRKAFEPTAVTLNKVNKTLAEARRRGDKVLGVHIRWDDNRGTERYFALEQYRKKMREISADLRPDKVSYFICSDETILESDFSSDCLISHDETPVVDLYTLEGCDYILGPESTFSGWASFYGEKPLVVMKKVGGSTRVERASIVQW